MVVLKNLCLLFAVIIALTIIFYIAIRKYRGIKNQVKDFFNKNNDAKAALTFGLILIIVLTISFAFIYPFWTIFRGSTYSNDLAAWGQFGDYFQLLVNILSTGGVFFISYLVYKSEKARDVWEKNTLELQDKPILVFIAVRGQYYTLMNVGKGVANKVIVGKMTGQNATNFDKPPYKAYSIPAGGHLIVNWATNAWALYARYEDVHDKSFLVRCVGDVNEQIKDDNISEFLKVNAQRKDDIMISAK